MIQACAYARVSTGMQVEAGSSLPSQLAEIRRYAERNGYQVVSEFVDEGESARTADRPEFQRMIAAAKSRNAPWKAIITWKNSRFARSREDSIIYKALLRRHGVSLLFAGEPNMDDSPTGRLMEAIIEAIDEFYSLNLAQEVLRGSKESALQGYATGGTAPFGMKKIPVQNEHGRMKWKYAPGDEAETVREIYRRYAEGIPLLPLCEWLNESGIRPPRKVGGWTAGQIWNVLFRYQEIYLGHVVYNKSTRNSRNGPKKANPSSEWSICRNAHEPVVSQELAAAVNKARSVKPLSLNRNHLNRQAQPRLLSGLVVCGVCGGPYSIGTSIKGKTRRLYYRCPRMGSCANRWLRCEGFEEAVKRVVLGRVSSGGFYEEAGRAIEKKRETASRDEAKQKAGLAKRREILSKKRERLIDAVVEGVVQKNEAAPRLEFIRRELEELDLRAVMQGPGTADPHNLLNGIKAIAETEMTPQALRALFSSTIDHIVVSQDGIRLSWTLPLDDTIIPF